MVLGRNRTVHLGTICSEKYRTAFQNGVRLLSLKEDLNSLIGFNNCQQQLPQNLSQTSNNN
jgi:hypothetical protein